MDDDDGGGFGSFMGMPGGASRMFGAGMPSAMGGGMPGANLLPSELGTHA